MNPRPVQIRNEELRLSDISDTDTDMCRGSTFDDGHISEERNAFHTGTNVCSTREEGDKVVGHRWSSSD